MLPIARWIWAALIALVVIIGCGGSGGGGSVTRFVGQWTGPMTGADGSNNSVNLAISDTGAITGSIFPANGPYDVVFTETGTIQGSGSFTITGTEPGAANMIVSGTLNQSGTSIGGTSTGCCLFDYLDGSGNMTNGTTQVRVTIHLQALL